jgi:hypothetical protein
MTKDQLMDRFKEIKKKHLQSNPHLSEKNQEMPSVVEMAKNLSASVLNNIKSIAAGNSLSVSEFEANGRLAICKGCEFYNSYQERCSKCGCKMAIKTYLKAEKCPIGKW